MITLAKSRSFIFSMLVLTGMLWLSGCVSTQTSGSVANPDDTTVSDGVGVARIWFGDDTLGAP